MERVLITGANGFIGSNLCSYFLEHSYEVYGLVRKSSDLHFLEGIPVKLIRGDLAKEKDIPLPSSIDYVIHAASLVLDDAPMAAARQNILDSTVNLVRSLESSQVHLKRFIYISTGLVLGYRSMHISEDNPGQPARGILGYTSAKKMAELFLMERFRHEGLPVLILRPTDVFGPNDRTSSLKILDSIDSGWPTLAGTGNRILSFCYVGNLAKACHLACQMRGRDGCAYTVANGQDVTWRQLMGYFQLRLGRPQRIFVPVVVAYGLAIFMQALHALVPTFEALLTWYRVSKLGRDTSYDISRTIDELGYQPDQDLQRQLESIFEWYAREKASGYVNKLRGR
ncbi:MAG: NAD-dependent epimerase/dehydratase family protein [Spirochaetia bacterium]|jgi:nucleoside-diphosphate-sugar epimerase